MFGICSKFRGLSVWDLFKVQGCSLWVGPDRFCCKIGEPGGQVTSPWKMFKRLESYADFPGSGVGLPIQNHVYFSGIV